MCLAMLTICADVVAELLQQQQQPNTIVATTLKAIAAGIASATVATFLGEDHASFCQTVTTVIAVAAITTVATIAIAATKVDNAPFTIGTAVARVAIKQPRQPAASLGWLWLLRITTVIRSIAVTAITDFGPELAQRVH